MALCIIKMKNNKYHTLLEQFQNAIESVETETVSIPQIQTYMTAHFSSGTLIKSATLKHILLAESSPAP